jgi:hypothetical protein
MLDIPSISGIVAAAGVIVGVAFTVLEIRNLVRQRQTDLIMRIYSTFGSELFLKSWKKIMTSESKDYHNYEQWYEWSDLLEVWVYFEGIGALLNRKLIDIVMVDDLLTGPIIRTWEKVRPIAEGIRKNLNYPQAFEWFEYLYNELKKREQQLASKTA